MFKHLFIFMVSAGCISATTFIETHGAVRGFQPKTAAYTYQQMQRDIQSVERAYPGIVHHEVIGKTLYGRNLYAISVGSGKTCVLVTGAHHGREWITSKLAMRMVTAYAGSFQQNTLIDGFPVRNILTQTRIVFIPMVNPDGVTLQQLGPGAFPYSIQRTLIKMNGGNRDFTEWKANAQGIDLNRQYDGAWSQIQGKVRTHPGSSHFKGDRPYSANEVRAVVQWIDQNHPAAEVAYHASGNVIFWGMHVNKRNDPRYGYALDLGQLTGYRVLDTNSMQSGGGLTDWWTYNLQKPGFTVEIGPFSGERPVPMSAFDSIWQANKAVGLYLASRVALEQCLSTTRLLPWK